MRKSIASIVLILSATFLIVTSPVTTVSADQTPTFSTMGHGMGS